MKRVLQIFLAIAVVFNLTAAAAGTGKPCHKPCCQREDASEYTLACSDCGSAISAPSMGCCGIFKDAERQATLNTGSILPNFDLASPASKAPARFAGATTWTATKHSNGAYESPPIFILNATFIC